MVIAVILLAAALAAAVALLLIRTANLRALTKALQKKQPVRLRAPDPVSEALAREIDRLLEAGRTAEIHHLHKQDQLRQDIANISHDLRTPLTSICGYLQLLQAGGLAPEEEREYLAIIGHRAASLQQLVSGFYDLSRLEAGGYPIELRPVRLQDILSGLVADSYDQLSRLRTLPRISIGEDLPPVLADPGGAERVFQNLLQNALRHGSSLAITAKRQQGQVVTQFANDAPGLTQDDIPRLFDRFFTADHSRGQGTGLGLAIVKSLCQAMEAQVEAKLTEGKLIIEVRWKALKP